MLKILAVATVAFVTAVAPVAVSAAPAAKPSDTDPEKMICRREVATGTLVGYRKICKTRADWDKESMQARQTMQEQEEKNLIFRCPNPQGCG